MSLRKILNERVSISKLMDKFGAETRTTVYGSFGKCLLHPESGRVVMIYPDEGLFECLECGVKGDVLDFMTNVVNLSMDQVQNWLADEFNTTFDNYIESDIEPKLVVNFKPLSQAEIRSAFKSKRKLGYWK